MARMAVSKTVDLGSSPGVPATYRSVAELVDAPVSKSGARKGVRVRVSPERLLLRSGENGKRSPDALDRFSFQEVDVQVRILPVQLLKIPTARIHSYSALGTIA